MQSKIDSMKLERENSLGLEFQESICEQGRGPAVFLAHICDHACDSFRFPRGIPKICISRSVAFYVRTRTNVSELKRLPVMRFHVAWTRAEFCLPSDIRIPARSTFAMQLRRGAARRYQATG